MVSRLFFLSFFVFSAPLLAQVELAAPNIIDNSETANGTRHIAKSDLNNDGLIDLIVAQGYQADRIVVYWNMGDGSFSPEIVDTNVSDPVFIACADINGNGFMDILAIEESDGNLYWYANNNGVFSDPIIIDTEQTFGKKIVAHDFDDNGTQDLVVIWQHSINFYRNAGAANFSKEPILTTESSPNMLECWTLLKSDVNQDGHMDVVTGETIGGVIYTNDGNANFTPETFTLPSHTTISALTEFDANADSFPDFVMQRASGNVSLYTNTNGSSAGFNFESDLFQPVTNSIKEFMTSDFDADGNQDLYTAHQGTPYLYLSGENLDFSENMVVYDDESLFIDRILTADIDNDGNEEIIWSAVTGTLAYHSNGTLDVPALNKNSFEIFPIPATNRIEVRTNNAFTVLDYVLYGMHGKVFITGKILEQEIIDVQQLSDGMYFLEISTNGKKLMTKKLLVKH